MGRRPPADLARALHREVGREVMRCTKARATFLEDEDAESLHHLRVSLRRLRALARLARPYLRPPKGVDERGFRRIGRSLAALRDHDVGLEALRAAATRGTPDDREIVGAALDQLLARRDAELRRVRRRLKARPATKLFRALDAWTGRPRPTALGSTPVDRGARALARGLAEQLFADRTWGRKVGPRGAERAHHRLRRRVRRARYQMETVAAVLGHDASRTLGWLSQVQDALGAVQDVGAVEDLLGRTGRGRGALEAECVVDWGARQQGRGATAWDRLRGERVPWKRRVAGPFD